MTLFQRFDRRAARAEAKEALERAAANAVANKLCGYTAHKNEGGWALWYWKRMTQEHTVQHLIYHTNETDWKRLPDMPHCRRVEVFADGRVIAHDLVE
jgi:hypothetical protein